jgi:hypothetical protein
LGVDLVDLAFKGFDLAGSLLDAAALVRGQLAAIAVGLRQNTIAALDQALLPLAQCIDLIVESAFCAHAEGSGQGVDAGQALGPGFVMYVHVSVFRCAVALHAKWRAPAI